MTDESAESTIESTPEPVVQPTMLTVLVLVNASRDWDAALGTLAAKVVGKVGKAKPKSWSNTDDPSHLFAVLEGLRLDDVKLLRAAMRDGTLAQWQEVRGTVAETLEALGLHVHPLA